MVTSFHGFTVKEKIGAGGMSTVYRGRHKTLGYEVAIKIMHPGMGGDQSFISRFEREAKAASSLHSNNIAQVIDFGSEDGIYFIVMQYIDGEDLGKLLKRVVEVGGEAQFPLEISLTVLEGVAYGLKDAHEQGIIHRDIKPSNILFNKKGEVKIGDFGLARDIGRAAALDLTMPGTVVGTPSYMSPEQAVGGELDLRTDIFSLGVMAYQMLIGLKPFTGASPAAVQEQIINADPPAPNAQNCPRITPELVSLLAKSLAKDPANRFQNMDQVIRALMAAQESIDPSGSMLKYKREYMAKFAAAPLEFSQELRQNAVEAYLKRGFYFKNQGLSNINDAIREFDFVLSMEPDHSRALNAVAELRKKAEESGIQPVARTGVYSAGMGETRVLPTGMTTPTFGYDSAAPEADSGAPGKRSHRGRVFGILSTAAVIAVALIYGLGRRDISDSSPDTGTDSSPPVTAQVAAQETLRAETAETTNAAEGTGGAEVVVAEPPVSDVVRINSSPKGADIYLRQEGESFRLLGRAPITERELAVGTWEIRAEFEGYSGQSKVVQLREGQDRDVAMVLDPVPVAALVIEAPPGPGYLKMVVVPYGNVFVDGKLMKKEARGLLITEVPADAQTLRISHPAIIGDILISELAIVSGDTLDLLQQQFRYGGLKVAASVPDEVDLLIDSQQIVGKSPLTVERVLVGARHLMVEKTGFRVDKVWLYTADGRRELTPVESGPQARKYRVDIREGETQKVKFDLKAK